VPCAQGEPGGAPHPLRIFRQVLDPFSPTAHGYLVVRCEVAADERESDRGLLAGDDHVECLDSEGAALAVCAIDDPNGVADPIAVAKREHCDHESTSEVALVLERSS